ncbi:MAG: ATP-binding cassette domain-containing protein, partial [Rhodobacteraceae bacterium]|nr:ATP-binding cassette domain-containing protein [Paracoccaceae bacterium]
MELRGVSWRPKAARELVLRETSLSLDGGRVLGVVGPNGAGKTTLLRLLYRFHRPSSGQVLID